LVNDISLKIDIVIVGLYLSSLLSIYSTT